MSTVIVRYRGGNKEEKKIWEFREKKMKIPDSDISKCPEYEVKFKIGKIFANEKIHEEYCVKIWEIDLSPYEHY